MIHFEDKTDHPTTLFKRPSNGSVVNYHRSKVFPSYFVYLVKLESITDEKVTFYAVDLAKRAVLTELCSVNPSDPSEVWTALPSTLPEKPADWTSGDPETSFALLALSSAVAARYPSLTGGASRMGAGPWPPRLDLLAASERVFEGLRALAPSLAAGGQSALAAFAQRYPEVGATAAGTPIQVRGSLSPTRYTKYAPFGLDLTAAKIIVEWAASAPDKGYRAVLAEASSFQNNKLTFKLLRADTPKADPDLAEVPGLVVYLKGYGNTDFVWPGPPACDFSGWDGTSDVRCGVLLLSQRYFDENGLVNTFGDPIKTPKGTEKGDFRMWFAELNREVTRLLDQVEDSEPSASKARRELSHLRAILRTMDIGEGEGS